MKQIGSMIYSRDSENGHVGEMVSIRCRELSASRRLAYNFIKSHNIHHFNAVLHLLRPLYRGDLRVVLNSIR